MSQGGTLFLLTLFFSSTTGSDHGAVLGDPGSQFAYSWGPRNACFHRVLEGGLHTVQPHCGIVENLMVFWSPFHHFSKNDLQMTPQKETKMRPTVARERKSVDFEVSVALEVHMRISPARATFRGPDSLFCYRPRTAGNGV